MTVSYVSLFFVFVLGNLCLKGLDSLYNYLLNLYYERQRKTYQEKFLTTFATCYSLFVGLYSLYRTTKLDSTVRTLGYKVALQELNARPNPLGFCQSTNVFNPYKTTVCNLKPSTTVFDNTVQLSDTDINNIIQKVNDFVQKEYNSPDQETESSSSQDSEVLDSEVESLSKKVQEKKENTQTEPSSNPSKDGFTFFFEDVNVNKSD